MVSLPRTGAEAPKYFLALRLARCAPRKGTFLGTSLRFTESGEAGIRTLGLTGHRGRTAGPDESDIGGHWRHKKHPCPFLLSFLIPILMASVWRHPKSPFWSACYTLPDGGRVKESTKMTDRKKALQVANVLEMEATRGMSEKQARDLVAHLF